MKKENTSNPTNHDSKLLNVDMIRKTGNHLNDAIDNASLCYSILNDLSSLFLAIKSSSDEHSQIRKLANIGQYLADDWANMIDCAREELENKQKTIN